MQIASGKVIGGRIELDAELPEGASVTVITRDADETFEVDEATEQRWWRANRPYSITAGALWRRALIKATASQ